MIPSILARQIRQGLRDFLTTTFPITTPFFHGVLEKLLDQDGEVFKGPYIDLGLPFRKGNGLGKDFFPDIPLSFRPYLHQEQAFERLSGRNGPRRNTIVATGTGSGKTECFVLPILDHCYERRGEPGIKAIIIYPMNALATDQAARIARAIYENERLRGNVTAGLYIGQSSKGASKTMGPDSVIANRDTLRLRPPDILLTNYKMLDYLLIRPDDLSLWQANGPETLQFLVVDELHTFDGAQGTDLACLIRRLKARLRTPGGHLCCVGTSATLGSKEEQREIIQYAGRIFGEPFSEDAIIEEERLGADEFLADAGSCDHARIPDQGEVALVDPERYEGPDEFFEGVAGLWFGKGDVERLMSSKAPLVELGRLLKAHPYFRGLLRATEGPSLDLEGLCHEVRRELPEISEYTLSHQKDLLSSMLALVSMARQENGHDASRPLPFCNVRLQFWMRELRRMVCSVDKQPRLRFSDDLSEEQIKRHLPLINCRECGATGWAAHVRQPHLQVLPDLQQFYPAFFSNSPDILFLFPEMTHSQAQGEDCVQGSFCPHCLHISLDEKNQCPDCTKTGLIPVLISSAQGNRQRDCPFCKASRGLAILGSRAASLSSVDIAQLFSSRFNPHKKLITFSDSVQDAAHRAGFFTARTWRFTLRSAIQRVVESEDEDSPITLFSLHDRFASYWRKRLDDEAFVSRFIAPNMLWFRDFEEMKKSGRIPDGSRLLEDVSRRISWEITSEYGFNSRIGRTLEKSGASTAVPDPGHVKALVSIIKEAIENEIEELKGIDEHVLLRFILGLLTCMKQKGAVYHQALKGYLESGGNPYFISQRHIKWMPNFGPTVRLPSFVTLRVEEGRLLPLFRLSGKRPTWFQDWAIRCFEKICPLPQALCQRLFEVVIPVMGSQAMLVEMRARAKKGPGFRVWGIDPDRLLVSRDVFQARCTLCGHSISMARMWQGVWQGAFCMRQGCSGTYQDIESGLDYYGRLYSRGDIQRIFAQEHTALIDRDEREEIEARFKEERDRRPWYPNILSCTPTLELGIDIGDLSSVLLCSVPPAQANYLQRIGRAGRKDGNALTLTIANARNHDLYFFSQPEEMIRGRMEAPGVFLMAAAVLERQLTAFCLDRWVEEEADSARIPKRLGQVLNHIEAEDKRLFPFDFLLFVERNRRRLLDGFKALFEDELSQDAVAHLEGFISKETGAGGGLAYRVVQGLMECRKARDSLKTKVQALGRKIKRMEASKAQDKNFEKDLGELKGEKAALNRLIKGINEKDVLNFFTDEGLIPNYAFPEAGVVLRSVIYRKNEQKRHGGQHGRPYDTWSYEFERPAVSALSEFAPNSSFYAEGRRVKIDQVDLAMSGPETWRFCNNCSFAQREAEVEHLDSCPRCGSTMWADQGQRKQMIRLRQVFSHSSDIDSRIADDSDGREPQFFVRQMFVDCNPRDVEAAWTIDDEQMPFGYEFLSKARFRDINLGRLDDSGSKVTIAGKEFTQKGFVICKYCGKVQDRSGNIKHAPLCSARRPDSKDNLTECVYLYREFESEALRILLPVSEFWESEKRVQSFIAALQLGLKERFRGSVDHLQVTLHEEPVGEAGVRKKFLVLYDTVPGGTGYLRDLVRTEGPMMEVLEAAFIRIKNCPCGKGPEKDGCYRCLYAYRSSRYMNQTSRQAAMELLSGILKHRDRIKRVKDLSAISMNGLLESELEAMFIDVLSRAGSNGQAVTVEKKVVNQKPGWSVRVGDSAWDIEPQVELGKGFGISEDSRADFVFWPARAREGVLPIVLFTDGYAYHQNRIGKDMAQRMAICSSRRFHCWSLTWKDVRAEGAGTGDHFENFIDPLFLKHGQTYRKLLEKAGLSSMYGMEKAGSFGWFVKFLEDPDAALWRRFAFCVALLFLDFKNSDEKDRDDPFEKGFLTAARELFHLCKGRLFSGQRPFGKEMAPELVRLLVAAYEDGVRRQEPECMAVGAVIDDSDSAKAISDGFERAWNGYLRLFNLFQFLPNVFFTTSTWLELHGMTEPFGPWSAEDRWDRWQDTGAEHDEGAWQEVFELTDARLHPLLELLLKGGCPVPEPGLELCDSTGRVVAEAELGWEGSKVAVLGEGRGDFKEIFKECGWVVFSFEEAVGDPDSISKAIMKRIRL